MLLGGEIAPCPHLNTTMNIGKADILITSLGFDSKVLVSFEVSTRIEAFLRLSHSLFLSLSLWRRFDIAEIL